MKRLGLLCPLFHVSFVRYTHLFTNLYYNYTKRLFVSFVKVYTAIVSIDANNHKSKDMFMTYII